MRKVRTRWLDEVLPGTPFGEAVADGSHEFIQPQVAGNSRRGQPRDANRNGKFRNEFSIQQWISLNSNVEDETAKLLLVSAMPNRTRQTGRVGSMSSTATSNLER